MSYDDLSQVASEAGVATLARADIDSLTPGVAGPASGNTITGSGTITGQAGADSVGSPPGVIVAVQGSTAGANGEFVVVGQYGTLTMQPDGSYTYVRNAGAPDGVDDVFNYTLADQSGQQSTSTLTIELDLEPTSDEAIAALQGVPGVISLPPGVELSDIHVVGRDLVIDLPDGTQMVIPGGAVFVPQLVIGDVELPASNLAALLIDSEPQPAAGPPLSSGGNFATDVPPLDPGIPLGDLIPPTELVFQPPEFEDIGQFVDEEPEVGPNLAVQLDDDALAGGNPGGSGDDADAVNVSGTLSGSGGDGALTFALLDTGAPAGFIYALQPNGDLWVLQGSTHVLTVTVNSATGAYTVTQVSAIDHLAGSAENNVIFNFNYSVTDADGDSASGSLTVNVDDDTPLASNDTDSVDLQTETATGNVITGSGTNAGTGNADRPGADGFDHVIGIASNNVPANTDSTADGAGNYVVQGEFGALTLNENGSYTYVLNEGAPGGSTDVFTYTYVDGDGDTVSATLTITNPDSTPNALPPAAVIVDDDDLPAGNHDDAPGDNDPTNQTGQLTGSGGDGDLDFYFSGSQSLPSGFTYSLINGAGTQTLQISQNETLVLTITLNNETGAYSVVQNNPVDHSPGDNFENNQLFDISFYAQDADGDQSAPAILSLNVDDDMPVAVSEPDPVTGLVDEDDLPNGVGDTTSPGDADPGNDDGDNDGTTTGGAAGSLTALFDIGADQPGTIGLSTTTSGLPALTSNGSAVVYDVTGNVLTGYVESGANAGFQSGEDTTIFTLTVNGDGSWVFDLEGQLDHETADTEDDLLIDFSSVIVAEDADGDTATAPEGSFVVTVDDDMPVNFSPVDLIDTEESTLIGQDDALVNNGSATATRLLNDSDNDGTGEDFMGADGFGSLVFSGGSDGDPLLDSGGNPLTSGGQAILVSGFGTDTLTAYVESGDNVGFQNGEDTVVFTATLDPGTGYGDDASYTITFSETIDNGGGSVFDDFSATPAGQNDWVGIDGDKVDTDLDGDLEAIDIESPLDPNPDSLDLLITPHGGGTINTSATDIGNANQWMDEGEGIRLDFVTDLRRDLGQDEKDVGGYLFDGHGTVTDAGFTILQTKGGGDASVLLRAVFDDDSGTLDTLDGTTVNIDISSITVTGDADGLWDAIDMGDGTVVITGLSAGAVVEFETIGGAPFNALEIDNAALLLDPDSGVAFGGDDFGLGGFGFTSTTQGSDVDFSLEVTATDADGDTSTGTIDIVLVPDTSSSSTLTTLSAQTTQVESSMLLATNDNTDSSKGQQGYSNNTMIFGAVAAAGLMAGQAAASDGGHGQGQLTTSLESTTLSSSSPDSLQTTASDDSAVQSSSGETGTAGAGDQLQQSSSSPGSDDVQSFGIDGADDASAAAPIELPQGTDAPSQGEAAAVQAATAAAVAMPSVEQLAALAEGPNGVSTEAQGQIDDAAQAQLVGNVLADALAGGGGHESAIDAVLNSLPNHGPDAALEALATHGAVNVPGWDATGLAAFAAAHPVFTMETMMLHPDAPPAAQS